MAQAETLAIYCAKGGVYIRWTACSILSLVEKGGWKGKIEAVVSTLVEKKILEQLLRDVPGFKASEVEVPWKDGWPGFMFKPFALRARARQAKFPEQVFFVDCDVLFSGAIEPFFQKIDGKFWVDRIYTSKKVETFRPNLEQVLAELKLPWEEAAEYNSGLYLIPDGKFGEVVTRTADLAEKYYHLDEHKRWTDQVFFAPAARGLGLPEPFLVEGFVQKDAHTFAEHVDKGFHHFSGDWRMGKDPWLQALKKSGFEKELKRRSRELLTPDEYAYLWKDRFRQWFVRGKSPRSLRQSVRDFVKEKRLVLKYRARGYATSALDRVGLKEPLKRMLGR